MKTFYADFHIHIGRALGAPVKISAAPRLTVEAVMHEARVNKGLDVITLIDGVCTNVLTELTALVERGTLTLIRGGGYQHDTGLVVFPGAEVEVAGPNGGAAHFGCWFPNLQSAADFHAWLKTVQKNPSLSSQRARTDARTLQRETKARKGLFIVHHAFTPHKGLYGNCVARLSDMVDVQMVDALELGLSADTEMADCVSELAEITFISNSDAHSASKIAREYNALRLERPTFDEVSLALHREAGRQVSTNFGLQPELGKYHRTRCASCGATWPSHQVQCKCTSHKYVMGVYDRLVKIRDLAYPVHPEWRPRYQYQVPLEFVPGLGKKALQQLLSHFGTEMSILNSVDYTELERVAGTSLASAIHRARTGKVRFEEGGGGTYGKVIL